MTSQRYFVTSVGTEHGKTYVSRGLTLRARADGLRVAALKPMETGVDPVALDATALANASGDPSLASLPAFYRAKPPLAPAAITRRGGPSVPPTESLAAAIDAVEADLVLVEGAGGVRVPIDDRREVRDLIAHLGCPAILVAHNALGVLSYTLTAYDALGALNIPVAAVVLTEFGSHAFRSARQTTTRPSRRPHPRPGVVSVECDPAVSI